MNTMVKIQPIFQNSNSPIYVGKIISRWSLKLSFLYTLSPKCFWVLWQKFIKVEIRMKRFLKFFWKNDFLSLFCWVWIKSHSLLFSPVLNLFNIFIPYFRLVAKSPKYIGKRGPTESPRQKPDWCLDKKYFYSNMAKSSLKLSFSEI